MATSAQSIRRNFVVPWVLATFGGWILGVLLVLVIGALTETFHIGNQFPVGLGMGLGIGLAQWLVARKGFGASSRWMWASAAGMAAPFLISDLVGARWDEPGQPLLYLDTAAGALIAGVWQWQILRSRSPRAAWWVLASLAAWVGAAGLIVLVMVPGRPESPIDMWRNVGVMVSGGLVPGIIGGAALAGLLRSAPRGRLPARAATDPAGRLY